MLEHNFSFLNLRFLNDGIVEDVNPQPSAWLIGVTNLIAIFFTNVLKRNLRFMRLHQFDASNGHKYTRELIHYTTHNELIP